ncbi:MAG: DUF1289 domain-containing protein [Thalassobaculaceae bacterium]|nr:DUF1289 domain-containing protein [Thalassobaculaceae bacterium]
MTSEPPRPAATVASPCVGVCSIDRETRFCLGCFRSMEEIAHWSRYDDTKRLDVIEALRQRQTEAGVNRRRVTKRRRLAGSAE